MKIWITSDLHFGHKNILRYNPETRPFRDVDHMNEMIISEWNEKVSDEDVIYHLGDFSFTSDEETKNIIKRLRGNKKFIRGNHDKVLDRALSTLNLRHLISNYTEISYVGLDKKYLKICLFHYPQVVWNKSHHGSIQFHGHCHGSLNYMNVGKRRLDVGFDSLGRIVTLDEAVRMVIDNKVEVLDHHGSVE